MPAFSFCGDDNLSAREFVHALLARAVDRVNQGVSTTLTSRRSSERPPRDPRHLTDTRTRVSTLLEYSVAYEMNNVLAEEGHGYSISTVLWNVFPDLIVRDEHRANVLGLEVKALHTAAEEKSANLETPVQIIRSEQDCVVILIWGWMIGEVNGTSITYPHIHACGVFDAWLLAKIRDYGWLWNQNARVKGIDLCTPIIDGADGKYKAEEGNLGKLMRIAMPEALPTTVPSYAEMKVENERYTQFMSLVLALGLRETFLDVCTLDGAVNVVTEEPHSYPNTCRVLGGATRSNGTSLSLIAGPRPSRWLRDTDDAAFLNGATCLWLSQKLNWKVYRKEANEWGEVASGQKPDSELDAIRAALGVV